MLIINADDLGRTVTATDNSISYSRQGEISSVSAMVHPAVAEHHEYLISAQFRDLIVTVPKGNYRMLFPLKNY